MTPNLATILRESAPRQPSVRPAVALSSAAQPNSKRDAVMGAALELFAERGFHGTSVPAIAERAGVGAGTIYRHFDSKEALVNELFRACRKACVHQVLVDFPADAPPREMFRTFFFRLSSYARSAPQEFAFLVLHYHADYLDARSRQAERNALQPFEAFLEHTRALGLTKAVPASVLMPIVWGTFAGLFKSYRLRHLSLTDDVVAQAEACAWDAIARPPRDRATR
jgi:AcrR family transcriptional regulator